MIFYKPETGKWDRRHQIVELLAQGLRNKEIARQLGIEERTVKSHLRTMYLLNGITVGTKNHRTVLAFMYMEHMKNEREKAKTGIGQPYSEGIDHSGIS